LQSRSSAMPTAGTETDRETTRRGEAACGMSPRSNARGVAWPFPSHEPTGPLGCPSVRPVSISLPSTPLRSGGRSCTSARPSASSGFRRSPLRRHARWRPLRESVAALLRRPGANPSVSFRPRGFAPPRRLPPPARRGLVASRCRPWGSRVSRPSLRTPFLTVQEPFEGKLVDSRARIAAAAAFLSLPHYAPSYRRERQTGP